MVNSENSAIESKQTINLMLILMAGNSLELGETVDFKKYLAEFNLAGETYAQ